MNEDNCVLQIDGTNPCTSQDATAICYDGVDSFQCDCSDGFAGELCTEVGNRVSCYRRQHHMGGGISGRMDVRQPI